MHLDLVDVLRCDAAHEDSWLVCATTRIRDRELQEGWLSCPVCKRQFPVHDGVVGYGESSVPTAPLSQPSDSDIVQLAAALDLTRSGLLVVLAGEWGAYADGLSSIAPARVVMIDPPIAAHAHGDQVTVRIRGARGVPLPTGQVHAMALDALHGDATTLADAQRVLRSGGRLVVPGGQALPAGLTLIAEDARMRVAVTTSAMSAPVPLRRRS
jgi:uncharacterized protein YbaR (Trm112 family)